MRVWNILRGTSEEADLVLLVPTTAESYGLGQLCWEFFVRTFLNYVYMMFIIPCQTDLLNNPIGRASLRWLPFGVMRMKTSNENKGYHITANMLSLRWFWSGGKKDAISNAITQFWKAHKVSWSNSIKVLRCDTYLLTSPQLGMHFSFWEIQFRNTVDLL